MYMNLVMISSDRYPSITSAFIPVVSNWNMHALGYNMSRMHAHAISANYTYSSQVLLYMGTQVKCFIFTIWVIVRTMRIMICTDCMRFMSK